MSDLALTHANGEIVRKKRKRALSFARRLAEKQRSQVVSRSEGRCSVCDICAPFTLHLHHIRPVSDGHPLVHIMMSDEQTIENLVALCPNCHAVVEKLRTQLKDNYHFLKWLSSTYGAEKEVLLRSLSNWHNR